MTEASFKLPNRKRRNIEKQHRKGRLMLETVWRYDKDQITPELISQVGRTPAPCSCHMCRSPRYSCHYSTMTKLTMQERKDIEFCKCSIDELYNKVA